MPVFPLPARVLSVGAATPFALRDKTGVLLVPRGTLVATVHQLRLLEERELYVDETDSETLRRATAGRLDAMLRQGALIGDIAEARASAADIGEHGPVKAAPPDPQAAWSSLQMRLASLLHDPAQADFAVKASRVQAGVADLLDHDADAALLLLVHAATSELHDYSARHALLVAVVCELAARNLPEFDAAARASLRGTALTMHIAIAAMQNQLATQGLAPSPAQCLQIERHPADGAARLRAGGIADAVWLNAVEGHHDTIAGPLAALVPAQRIARLAQRADQFVARLSPRKGRSALSATAAAKGVYLDEHRQADEAGSAIIRATGLYPPGSLVRLKNKEIAVVLRRGRIGTEPVVACIVNAQGEPVAQPMLRNTRLAACAVTAGLAPHEVKVRLNADRLLRLA